VTQAQIDRYISPKETAQLLGVTDVRVGQLAQAGKLPHLNTPIGRLYPRQEIEELADARSRRRSQT
jgi:excisionase family DNA binding protein